MVSAAGTSTFKQTAIRTVSGVSTKSAAISDSNDESIAIPFIRYDAYHSNIPSICPDAVEFLNSIKQKIGVISVCGKYRTGKSYLMNKLFFE